MLLCRPLGQNWRRQGIFTEVEGDCRAGAEPLLTSALMMRASKSWSRPRASSNGRRRRSKLETTAIFRPTSPMQTGQSDVALCSGPKPFPHKGEGACKEPISYVLLRALHGACASVCNTSQMPTPAVTPGKHPMTLKGPTQSTSGRLAAQLAGTALSQHKSQHS